MNIEIPKEIKYLEPFISYLEELDPNEIDESVDVPLLQHCLYNRVYKHSVQHSLKLLQKDVSILTNWIETNGGHQSIFIINFIQLDENFVKQIKASKHKDNIMEKKIKFVAKTPESFSKFKHGNVLTYIKPNICAIVLESLQKSEVEILSTIEQETDLKKINSNGLSIISYNWQNRIIYRFTKNDYPFKLTVDPSSAQVEESTIIDLINSIECK